MKIENDLAVLPSHDNDITTREEGKYNDESYL